MFNEDSTIVKQQIFLIEEQKNTIDDVPDISNLKEVVQYVLVKRNSSSIKNDTSAMEGGI